MPVKRRKPGRRALELATKRLLALRSLTAAGSRLRPSLLASVICSVDSHSFKPEHGLLSFGSYRYPYLDTHGDGTRASRAEPLAS